MEIKQCKRCLYKSNHPLGITFNKDGICSGCQIHEEKDSLNWNDTVKQESDTIDSENTNTSSPFISTELYNKIMHNDNNNMIGGNNHLNSSTTTLNIDITDDSSTTSHESSTSTSELSQILSLSDYKSTKSDYKSKKSQTGSSIEAYGFSNTSSELSQKFVINSDTSISKMDNSSSINTSDINLVSIDKNDSEINYASANSVNGKRYL